MDSMFGRQWFRPGSQYALRDESLDFEYLLRSRQYTKAHQLASTFLQNHNQHESPEYWLRQLKRLECSQKFNMKNLPIVISFAGFWPGFNAADNELYNLFDHAAKLIGREMRLGTTDANIVVFSCFDDFHIDDQSQATRFLYLGENVRPDYSHADYSLTFDMSDYSGRNIYMPLWVLRSNKYAPSNPGYLPYSPKELESKRPVNGGGKAVVYIGNNSTPARIEAIHTLKQLGWIVECYGSQSRPVDNKIAALSNSRFNLCFENSYTPGYVTEKLIDSFLAASIPIYWGGAPLSIFNRLSYFNCDPYLSISHNIRHFSDSHYVHLNVLPPLLHENGFNKVEASALSSLSKILLDLF
jgi:hypothetical protein